MVFDGSFLESHCDLCSSGNCCAASQLSSRGVLKDFSSLSLVILFCLFYFMSISILPAYLCITCVPAVHRGQNRALDPWSWSYGWLRASALPGNELWPFAGASVLLTTESSLQALSF